MDRATLLEQIEKQGIRRIKLGGFDMDGILRGKYVSAQKFESALEKGLGFCDVIFGWDAADNLYDNVTMTGWHTGYPDTLARIEPDSFRVIPWEAEDRALPHGLLGGRRDPAPRLPDAGSQARRPRGRAARVPRPGLVRVQSTSSSGRRPTRPGTRGFRDLTPLSPGMFGYSVLRASTYADLVTGILDQMNDFRCTIEGIHTETGPGVYETALAVQPAVEAAVRAALFKTGVKEIAAKQDLLATFMGQDRSQAARVQRPPSTRACGPPTERRRSSTTRPGSTG